MRFFPLSIRKIFSYILNSVSPTRWDSCFSMVSDLLPNSLNIRHSGEKIHKISSLLQARNEYEFYSMLVSIWHDNNPVIGNSATNSVLAGHRDLWSSSRHFSENMMDLDMVTYLPDDILVKVDRSSMSVGLETRAPFLDYRVVEFATGLPLDYKIHNNEGKLILRSLLKKHIPRNISNQTKSGFSVPIHEWLRGPLKEWSEDLLSEETLNRQGFFNVKLIRDTWQDHLSGKRNAQYLLWSVLMFQLWMSSTKISVNSQ